MKILVINGANLNMLGRRDPRHYGDFTLSELEKTVKDYADGKNVAVKFFQSNHEGDLVDKLQQSDCDAVILNAGAYSHYSYALRDCIECLGKPVAEVHLSDIYARESFRHNDVLAEVCARVICGKGIDGYLEALDFLCEKCKTEKIR